MKLSRRAILLGSALLCLLLVGAAGTGWVLYKRRTGMRPMTPEEAFEDGKRLLEARDLPTAYSRLGYAALHRPDDVEIQWTAARAALQMRRRDVALPHLQAAWAAGRKDRETLLALVEAGAYKTPQERLQAGLARLAELPEGPARKEVEGDLRMASGAPAEALAAWRELFAAAPGPSLASKIGFAHLALGKPKEAEAFLAPLRRTPSLDDQGYALLALLQAERDDRAGAEAVYAEGRKAWPDSEVLRLNEALYLLSEGKTAEAVALLDPLKGRAADAAADARRHAARLFLGFACGMRLEGAALKALEEAAAGDAPWLEGERVYYRALRAVVERKEPGKEDVANARKLVGAHAAVEWTYARELAQAGQWAQAAAAYRGVTGLLARSPLLALELAQAQYRSGKPEEALEVLRRLHARRLHSKASVELFRNLAIQKGLAKEAAEAQAFLAGQYKDDPDVAFAGGAMALRTGNLAEASRIFDELALRHPDRADVSAGRFAVLLEKKDFEGVLRECAASKADPALVARFRAIALVRLGRPDEAEQVLAAAASGADWTLQLLYANLLLSRDKTDAAAQVYAAVLRAQPRNEIARLGLATIASRARRWKDVLEHARPLIDAKLPVAFAYVLVGEAELGEGRAARALDAAARARDLSPDDAGAALLQGAALTALGRAEEAETLLAELAAKRPDDAGVQLHLARARIARGAYEEALKGVEAAAARAPAGHLPLQQVRLVLLAQTGRGPQARELLRRLADRLPPVEAALSEAWLLQREGRLDEAAAILRPHLPQRAAAVLWAEITMSQRRAEGVLEALPEAALDAAAWARLSEIARVNELPGLVVDFCRRALKTDPENASLLNNLAWFLVRRPGFDEAEALAAARKAASLQPTLPAVLHTYGTVLLACRKEQECIDVLQRSGAVLERSPKLMLLLSRAYEKLGDLAKSAQWTASCLAHPETAAVAEGELSRPALEQRKAALDAGRGSR